jgi:transcriptional regulator with XRE-family HTH domain
MTFAEKLKELRTAKGLSEAKLAEASGVAFGALHFYGLGRRKPSFAAVVKLANALGVTCEAFAECEDVKGDGTDDSGKPGRPPKRAAGQKAQPSLKKPRGRPKKQR